MLRPERVASGLQITEVAPHLVLRTERGQRLPDFLEVGVRGCQLAGNSRPGRIELAEDLRRRIEKMRFDDVSPTAKITISVGVATEIPEEGRLPEDLLRRADASLYLAKNEGRNLVHTNPEIRLPVDQDERVENEK